MSSRVKTGAFVASLIRAGRLGIAALATVMSFAAGAAAEEYNGAFSHPRQGATLAPTQRVIVKWRASSTQQGKEVESAHQAAKLSGQAGLRLKFAHSIAPLLDVLELPQRLQGEELQETLARLRGGDGVAFVEPDERRYPHRVPSDPLFATQWSLRGVETAATRAELAWDTSIGDPGVVVAVLDTGVRYDHPDLGAVAQGGKLLPGFDFVSADADGNFFAANDGNGRDNDASDPGDWIDPNDIARPVFSGCELSSSSWHGTRVSGIIGARSDNAADLAGIAWNPLILPLRVLGKCGGNDSDILSAMRWAGGLSVAGVPVNPTPARVINMSLGSDGPCRQSYVTVLNELTAAGVMVVASAGNDGGAVDAPGNCPNVIAVGAVRHVGTKVGFSNVGGGVTISAPGGNCVNTGAGQPCLFSIHTTVDSGDTVPQGPAFTDQFNINVGTSFSAPLVSGTVALMRSVNPPLPLAQVRRRLRESARPFPTSSTTVPAPPTCHVPTGDDDLQIAECICTTATCGAGMLSTAGAVISALRPFIVMQAPGTATPGESVALNATASTTAPGRTIATFAWEVLFSSGAAPTITGAGLANASVAAPATGEFALRLTVTDDRGAQGQAYVALRTGTSSTTAITVSQDQPSAIPPPPPPTPPPPSAGGGGGGALGWLALALLATLRLLRVDGASARTQACSPLRGRG